MYNERDALPELHARLTGVLSRLVSSYEIVLVNDASTDDSWAIILSLASGDRRTKAIGLSRNFGHQLAITAGLDIAQGDAVVLMDGDLQDPPEVIEALYAKFREGFDVVYAQRRTREGETVWKKLTARLFYRLMRRITRLDIPEYFVSASGQQGSETMFKIVQGGSMGQMYGRRFVASSIATIATALFKRGFRNQMIQGAGPLRPGKPNMVGEAFTLRGNRGGHRDRRKREPKRERSTLNV